jgi:nicotinamide-nucleotide amidase
MGQKQNPTCEIVTIGSELLIGQITDTNSTMLAQQLTEIGITVRFRTAAADRMADMNRVIREAAERCDLVITTGGLGPTEDDLTRQAIAEVAGVPLEFRPELMAEIGEIFRRSGYAMPENNRRQAFVPAGSEVVSNPVGTAPAFITLVQNRPVIALPGVPRELRYLMEKKVLAWIRGHFGLAERTILWRSLKVAGLGESAVDRIIGDLMTEGANPEVGLLASPGEITIRLAARGETPQEALDLIRPVEEEIRGRLAEKIYGHDEETLEGVVARRLADRNQTVVLLETFTGGRTAERLHQVRSGHVLESLVIPSRERLKHWVGEKGREDPAGGALRAARWVRDRFGADLGCACLGFPVPGEASYDVECEAAVAGEGLEKTFSWRMGGDLAMLRQRGSVIALNTLRLALLDPG